MVVSVSEEQWDMIGRRMRRAMVDRIVSTQHRDAFEKLLDQWEGAKGEIKGIPDELALEIAKAIRHRWGTRDAELVLIAEAIENEARRSMELAKPLPDPGGVER